MHSRPSGPAIVLALNMLACSPEPSTLDDAPLPANPPTSSQNPPITPTPSAIDLPPVEIPPAEPEEVLEPVELEPTPPSEPADPLAPILPDGPEPGSPESDAELTKLLDESTITQDEFDKAFRGGGPNIQGDEFVFGPGDRSRATPILEIGKPRVESGSIAVADIEAIARADERKLLACYAVALTDNPTSKGSVELHLVFDATGSKPKAVVESGEALAPSLVSCFVTIAESWRPKSAGGAKLVVPLKLSTQ